MGYQEGSATHVAPTSLSGNQRGTLVRLFENFSSTKGPSVHAYNMSSQHPRKVRQTSDVLCTGQGHHRK